MFRVATISLNLFARISVLVAAWPGRTAQRMWGVAYDARARQTKEVKMGVISVDFMTLEGRSSTQAVFTQRFTRFNCNSL